MDPIQRTRKWLEKTILELDLCPFAARPYRKGKVAFRVVEDPDFDEALRGLLAAVEELIEGPEISTTLVIFTQAFEEFPILLDASATADYLLEEAGLLGVFQVVAFHPDYMFWGNDPDDQANFANRSPYPMLHVLREDEVTDAVERHPDVQAIPETNIERLQALSRAEIVGRWGLEETQ